MRRSQVVTVRVAATILLTLATPGAVPGAEAPAPSPETAVRLYEDGKYDEARRILEAIDQEGKATGPLLYRLFFCRATAGDREGGREVLLRAVKRLEDERATAPTLEGYFYLDNAYASLGRSADLLRSAKEGVAALESGRIEADSSPISRFQVAKLHQDAGRTDEAVKLYGAALEAFRESGRTFPGSERWARRFLATTALSKADYATAEKHLTALTALPGASAEDWNRLAIARVRIGHFAEASDAWRESVRRDPENADDPRYSGRLAQTAAEVAPMPATSPSGKPWQQLTREELEAVMKDSATAVLDARRRLTPEGRKAFEDLVAKTRPAFVAAGLEYACRRLPIRETAFREGYAVLIFQDAAWSSADPLQN